MGSCLILVDLENHYHKYIVKPSRIVEVPVKNPDDCQNTSIFRSNPAYFLGWFLTQLQDPAFRNRVRRLTKSTPKAITVKLNDSGHSIDYKSSEMSLNKTYEYVELHTMLSWFSTFGGAYSNLGDEFENCAEMAGKISVHQMKLAFQLGDPFLISRCKLYYSIALIQRGILGPAKRIVRDQFRFAKQEQESDPKLVKMCLGIWSKLLYTQQQLRNKRVL